MVDEYDSVNAEEMNTIASVYYGFDMMAMFSHKSQVIRPRTFERAVLGAARGGAQIQKGALLILTFRYVGIDICNANNKIRVLTSLKRH